MTVTVLSAAHSAYRSGEPNHALSFNVDDGALAIISAGASNLNATDAAWVPTITDAGRTWSLRDQNRTSAGAAWVYEWFNDTGSTAAVSATVVFPSMVQNDPIGHVAVQLTGVADPSVTPPVVTKNPTGDTISTGHSNLEDVTLTVTTIGSQVVMFYGSWTGTTPTMRAGSSQSTSAPVSVDLEGGDGAYGCIWRTTTESATGSITIGATAPTSAFAGNIAIEYLPTTIPPSAPAAAPLGWFTPLSVTAAWFDTTLPVEGWGDEEAINEPAAGVSVTPADSAHGHTSDSPALTQTHALAPNDSAHGHAADSTALTQAHALGPVDAAHGHSTEQPTLTQAHSLTPADSGHRHGSESPTITQTHALVATDSTHGHTATSPAFTHGSGLATNDTLHSHGTESPTLTQTHVITVTGSSHGHTSTTPTLTTIHNLVPFNTTHAHASGAPTLHNPDLETPARRIHTLDADPRSHTIAAQNRTHTLNAEPRTTTTHPDPRTTTIPAQPRTTNA